MSTYQHPSQLAFFQETTQGTPPADGAAWVSDGTRIMHIAEELDLSGITRATVDNVNAVARAFEQNQKVLGLRTIDDVGFAVYATGSGATTAGGIQISETPLMTLLEHCLGGLHRSNSTTIGTVTSQTEYILGAATNIIPGCYVVIRNDVTGRCEPVRVMTVATNTITVDKAPGFTVTTDCTVEGCATAYIDQAVLRNSDGSGGPFTFSYLAQKGLAGQLENFVLMGCKTTLSGLELSRGELAKLSLSMHAGSYADGAAAPSPSWTSPPVGSAPFVVGPECACFFQNRGTTTTNLLDVTSLSFEFGMPVERITTLTESQANMQATAGYITTPSDTMASVSIVPYYDNNYVTDFEAQQVKTLRYMRTTGRGQGFAVAMHRCELAANPSRTAENSYSTTSLSLRALEDQDNASASNLELWKSKFVVALF